MIQSGRLQGNGTRFLSLETLVIWIGLSLCQIGTKDEKVGWGWDYGYDYRPTVLNLLPLRPTAASFST